MLVLPMTEPLPFQIALAEPLRGRDAVSLGSSFGVVSSPVVLRPGQMLLPGFVDAHVHAPQFPNAGLGYDKTLLDWLDTYTFPLEARYADQDFAARVYEAVVVSCGRERILLFSDSDGGIFKTLRFSFRPKLDGFSTSLR